MGANSIDYQTAQRLKVGEVMLSRPKRLSVDATVAEGRQLLTRRAVRLLLLVDGDVLLGSVSRDDLPVSAAEGARLIGFARSDRPTVPPDVSMLDAINLLGSLGRLPVVDPVSGTLRGLICLKSDGSGFCMDR